MREFWNITVILRERQREILLRYADQIVEYRNTMLAANSSMDGCLSLKRMPDPKEWVEYSYEWGNPLRELGEKGIRFIRRRGARAAQHGC